MSRQHEKMAEYCTLAEESIETIQKIVNGQSETPVQLNWAQCEILGQELAEVRDYLQGPYDMFKAGQDVRQIALLHLHSVIKGAELLVEKCCCKNVEPWLLEAMTLVEIQEDFAAIIVDLRQWRMTMDVAIAIALGASRDSIQKLIKTMDKDYQESYKSNHALQQAAVEDRKGIVLKLAEVQESEDSLEYLCALHLQSWLAELEDERHVTNSNVIQKLIKNVEKGSVIGMGGCGAVQDVKWLGVQCALKTLNVKDQGEATALKGLLHPNIVRLYLNWDDVTEIETPNEADGTDGHEIGPPIPKSKLLMELIDTDLSKYIKRRRERIASSSERQPGEGEDMMPFSLPVAIDIMLQVGQALRYMHGKHLAHRDLKTANILVRRVNKALTSLYSEGYLEIKLADFGLAKTYENTSTSERHTNNIGTRKYGAPEVFKKDWSTKRYFKPMPDVWSFGMTCSEILSGRAPYEDEPNVRTLHTRIVKQNLRPSLPKGCPEYLAFIIRGCWKLKPEMRPDFASICRMLRHAKLLSLGITKLDDSRPFLRYTTRSGVVRTLSNPRPMTDRFTSFLPIPFIPSRWRSPLIGEVQTVAAKANPVQSLTAREKQQPRNKLVFIDNKGYSFDLEDLLTASVKVLGKGSVGTTYKAELVDRSIMAVKRMNYDTDILAFESQIQDIRKFQHANVLPLCGYYRSKDDMLLVYDYIGMGSLFAVLHGNPSSSHTPLDRAARVKIATGAARGLAYLHTQGGPKYVHANIKSSNILVSSDINACISDNGLAQLLTSPSAQTKIIGGYQAPEVTELRKATQNSDVYSFGVLLLELLTRKAPTQAALNDLLLWVQSITQEDRTTKVLDAELLLGNTVEGEMVNLLQIAARCVDTAPERRPTMSEVQVMLEDVRSATSTNEFTNYDVFISHRGPDTETGFVSYLCKDLEVVGLQPFLDCRSMDMGEESWESTENAIKKTPIAVVVFSESFAASEWGLRELDAMLDTPSIKVVPIFYDVRRSEVRHPESSENEKLKEDFKKLSERHDKIVIERWRGRLEEASILKGWERPRESGRSEAALLSDIVRTILALADEPLPSNADGYVVGVKQVAEEIIQTLEMKKEVLMLGLWGMGGIGKSTLARELFNQMSGRYDSACYIEDVTEKVMEGGVVKVQQRILEDLCENNAEEIEDKWKGKTILEERLCKKRFLVVLDDVGKKDELEYWISRKMFGEDSKCIITSQNKSTLETSTSFDIKGEVYIHNVQCLSIRDSRRLFLFYAFGGHGRMKPGFEELVSSISKGCGGVPLLLKVCAAHLKNKDNVVHWREVLAKLEDGTIMEEKTIFECLRISYDDLPFEQQEMFLDVACALFGQHKGMAVRVWKSLNWSAEWGIRSLVDKALIIVDEDGCLRMHNHVRDMGREIVSKKRASEGIIRRLWMPEALTLVRKKEGLPSSLHSLNLVSSFDNRYKAKDHTIEFDVSHMVELRILMCNGPSKILSTLPRSMHWFKYENESDVQGSIPTSPQNNELVILEFVNSKFCTGAPKPFGELGNLEVLNLGGVKNLTMLRDAFGGLKKVQILRLHHSGIESLPNSFGELSNLEELDLDGCKALTMLPDSFGGLKKVQRLKLDDSGIESLPNSFGKLSNLEVLDLHGCKALTSLPDSFGGLKKVRLLRLDDSGIESLPNSFGELSNLEGLDLDGCKALIMLPDSFGGLKKVQRLKLDDSGIESLPNSFGELSNLEELDLDGCKALIMLPDSFGGLKKVQRLKLHDSGIESLPNSFGELSNLDKLYLHGCKALTMLPDSFGDLKKVRLLRLDDSGIESLPNSFGELSNLEELDLHGCKALTSLPDSFGGLKKVQRLKFDDSGIESLPNSFGELSNLEELDLDGCKALIMLPDSFGGLKKVQRLKLDDSGIESLPNSFGELSNLEVLDLHGCKALTSLPDSFGGLKKVQRLKLDDSGIESLPNSFGKLSNLEVLDLHGCKALTMLPDSFGGLKKVRLLRLDDSGIESLPNSFGELSNLEELDLHGCKALTMLPDAFGGLKKVQILKLDDLGIESLPNSFGELSILEELDLHGCKALTMLPDSFGDLKKVRLLRLDDSGIESLPNSFGELSNLDKLYLHGCKAVTMLPDSFGDLKKVRLLRLDDSGIESLPNSFGELSNLDKLYLHGCKALIMLPDSFGGLKKVQILKLDDSGIESLPNSFGELSNLEELDLHGCKALTTLSDSFGGLKKVQILRLDDSGIESLPNSFGELSNLEELDLDGCKALIMLPDSFGGLKKVQRLKLDDSGIESLPNSFGEFSNLEKLNLVGCKNLTMLPDSFE